MTEKEDIQAARKAGREWAEKATLLELARIDEQRKFCASRGIQSLFGDSRFWPEPKYRSDAADRFFFVRVGCSSECPDECFDEQLHELDCTSFFDHYIGDHLDWWTDGRIVDEFAAGALEVYDERQKTKVVAATN